MDLPFPFKKPNNFNDDFYYDDQGVIKGFEKSIQLSKEILKGYDEQIKTFHKLKNAREKMPSLFQSVYRDINMIQERQLMFEREMTVKEIIQVGGHIQSLKNIVALQKILRYELSHNSKDPKNKTLLDLLDLVASQFSHLEKEVNELKKDKSFIQWWKKATEDSKGDRIV